MLIDPAVLLLVNIFQCTYYDFSGVSVDVYRVPIGAIEYQSSTCSTLSSSKCKFVILECRINF
jgi:hypothetical protein